MPVSAGSGVVPVISRQLQSRQGPDLLKISDVIIPLLQFSPDDLPLTTTSLLLETSVDSLLSWVRVQRLMILPHEASKYDNEMKWIAAFVERLGASEEIIVPFTPDIHLATRLACGYCAMLLEVCILPNSARVVDLQ